MKTLTLLAQPLILPFDNYSACGARSHLSSVAQESKIDKIQLTLFSHSFAFYFLFRIYKDWLSSPKTIQQSVSWRLLVAIKECCALWNWLCTLQVVPCTLNLRKAAFPSSRIPVASQGCLAVTTQATRRRPMWNYYSSSRNKLIKSHAGKMTNMRLFFILSELFRLHRTTENHKSAYFYKQERLLLALQNWSETPVTEIDCLSSISHPKWNCLLCWSLTKYPIWVNLLASSSPLIAYFWSHCNAGGWIFRPN